MRLCNLLQCACLVITSFTSFQLLLLTLIFSIALLEVLALETQGGSKRDKPGTLPPPGSSRGARLNVKRPGLPVLSGGKTPGAGRTPSPPGGARPHPVLRTASNGVRGGAKTG